MYNIHYLIDCSYVIIFTANSTFKYYVNEYDIDSSNFGPDFDVMLDEEFAYLFEKNLIRNINNTCQKVFPIVNKGNYIFCVDCPRKDIWRRQLYLDYKSNRDDNKSFRFNMKPIFNKAYKHIIPNMIDEYGCCQIQCDYAEGDDVIGVLSKHITSQKNNKVVIVSSDRDMVQLYNDNVTIITCDGVTRSPTNEIQTQTKLTLDKEYSAEDYLLFKICLGDSGDNIPNIKHRLGPKKTIKLIDDKTKLVQLLKEDVNVKKTFQLNSQLISFDNIPNEIREHIISKYQAYLDERIDV